MSENIKKERVGSLLQDRSLLNRRTFVRILAGAGGAAFLGIPLYARFIEPWWVETTLSRIPIRGLPGPFENFTVAQLSDIHYHDKIPLEQVDEAVDLIMARSPDLIVLTGDFLYGFDENMIHPLAESLSRLKAPCGILAVPGNHDYWIFSLKRLPTLTGKEKVVFRALEGSGIQVLRNESITIRRNGEMLDVVGLDDYWSGLTDAARAFRGLDPKSPRLVLAHNPDSLTEIAKRRADLILCGHTHGGQINIPFAGPLVVPIQRMQFVAGLYPYRAGTVYVNRGFGFVWYPLRFNARPEISFFTLIRGDPLHKAL